MNRILAALSVLAAFIVGGGLPTVQPRAAVDVTSSRQIDAYSSDTTLAEPSDVPLPQPVLLVQSTAHMPASGTAVIGVAENDNLFTAVNYASKTSNSLLGCTGGSGDVHAQRVWTGYVAGASPRTVTITWRAQVFSANDGITIGARWDVGGVETNGPSDGIFPANGPATQTFTLQFTVPGGAFYWAPTLLQNHGAGSPGGQATLISWTESG